MARKKIFPKMLIETTVTEESRFHSQHRSSDLIWSRKKKECAGGNERFFVDQWIAKAKLLHSLWQFDVGLLKTVVCNTRSAT
jgi:hypothetical protein